MMILPIDDYIDYSGLPKSAITISFIDKDEVKEVTWLPTGEVLTNAENQTNNTHCG